MTSLSPIQELEDETSAAAARIEAAESLRRHEVDLDADLGFPDQLRPTRASSLSRDSTTPPFSAHLTSRWRFHLVRCGARTTRGSGSPMMMSRIVLSQTPLSLWRHWTSLGLAVRWTSTRTLNHWRKSLQRLPNASPLRPL